MPPAGCSVATSWPQSPTGGSGTRQLRTAAHQPPLALVCAAAGFAGEALRAPNVMPPKLGLNSLMERRAFWLFLMEARSEVTYLQAADPDSN